MFLKKIAFKFKFNSKRKMSSLYNLLFCVTSVNKSPYAVVMLNSFQHLKILGKTDAETIRRGEQNDKPTHRECCRTLIGVISIPIEIGREILFVVQLKDFSVEDLSAARQAPSK